MAPAPIVGNPHGYPAWSLRDNPALVAEVKAALADHGVSISLGEGFLILPGGDIAHAEADIELMANLGAQRLNVCALDPDEARNIAQFAAFADAAARYDLPVTLEFLPGMGVRSFEAALRVVKAAARPNASLLIDAMHFLCTGNTPAQLAATDPALIGYAQLCDAASASVGPDYFSDARNERPAPGEGVLPLAEFVRALPASCVIGLEVPMLARAEAGIGPEERLAPALATAAALLENA
jgi:sugar phosphate isomerase/epimerase